MLTATVRFRRARTAGVRYAVAVELPVKKKKGQIAEIDHFQFVGGVLILTATLLVNCPRETYNTKSSPALVQVPRKTKSITICYRV